MKQIEQPSTSRKVQVPMKILLVSNMYPAAGQIIFGIFIKNIERALRDGGFEVFLEVISGRGRTIAEKLGKYVHFYWSLMRTDLSSFDGIHISYPSHSFLPFFVKRRRDAKLIVRLHGHDLVPADNETFFWKLLRTLSLAACRRADGIVVPSPFFHRELERLIPNLRTPVLVIPSGGIDCSIFRPMQQPLQRTGETCFGYVGRLDQKKGIDLFLEALQRQGRDCRAIIVGDGPHRRQAEQLSHELGISERCQFVGPVDYNRLPEFYNQFDALVFPTLFRESFGNVILEAMACGVPVIASDHGAPADFISDGMDGFKFPPGDVASLSAAMERFSRSTQEERANFRENALEKARAFEASEVSRRYCAYVKDIIS